MPGRAVTLSSDPAHSRGPGSPPRCDPLTGLAVQVGGGRQASLSHLPAAPCVSRGSRRPALKGFPSSCTSLCQVSGSGSTCFLELSRPPGLPPPLPHQAHCSPDVLCLHPETRRHAPAWAFRALPIPDPPFSPIRHSLPALSVLGTAFRHMLLVLPASESPPSSGVDMTVCPF